MMVMMMMMMHMGKRMNEKVSWTAKHTAAASRLDRECGYQLRPVIQWSASLCVLRSLSTPISTRMLERRIFIHVCIAQGIHGLRCSFITLLIQWWICRRNSCMMMMAHSLIKWLWTWWGRSIRLRGWCWWLDVFCITPNTAHIQEKMIRSNKRGKSILGFRWVMRPLLCIFREQLMSLILTRCNNKH